MPHVRFVPPEYETTGLLKNGDCAAEHATGTNIKTTDITCRTKPIVIISLQTTRQTVAQFIAQMDTELNMKSLFHRLFGFGKIPAELKASLVREGIRIIDEGVAASITRINYRDPVRTCSWMKRSLTASIILTKSRLIALNHRGNKFINVPLTDDRLSKIQIVAERDELLLIAFDVSLFHPDWAGTMECRFHTPWAKCFVEELHAT